MAMNNRRNDKPKKKNEIGWGEGREGSGGNDSNGAGGGDVSSVWKLQMLVCIGFMDKINMGIVGLVSFTSLYLCLSIILLESHENVNFPFFT